MCVFISSGKCGILDINLTNNTQYNLSSYSYPASTSTPLACTWTVQTPVDTRVQLSFYEFLLYGDDVFLVGNGLDSEDTGSILLLRKGSVTPLRVRSTDNQMWITFTTDGSDFSLKDATLFLVEFAVYERGECLVTKLNDEILLKNYNLIIYISM